ncbi:hypothetical protein CCACVL1_26411 [Corchorus capsularis]|uniref:RRM domain-containing protein n=1 Tax=Corchorus capsularis TaxID=210143 RepID=A0A1R3GEW2_COCAP|nr:hypothetical protein CCACVL1_26411 [Corchorus capsularis]
MAAFYAPPSGPPHYPYYQAPPPPAAVALAPLPPPPPPGAAAPLPHHHHSFIPQHHPPPQPPPSYIVPYAPAYSSYDSVRTLFIAGLPEDIQPREIYNLFREFPGYESSHLRNPNTAQNSQAFAFAVFSDQQSAIGAMQALNGMVFDLEKGSTLFIELAKSNSRSKRPRADDEWTSSDKKSRGLSTRPKTDSAGFGSVYMSGMSNSAHNTIGYPSAQSSGHADANADPTALKSSAPPCPTLFVANLGANCTEDELIQVFSRCPGFLKLKMQSTYGAPVAFVDFQDTASSTGAMNSLQGTILYSSPPGDGMRLEYPLDITFILLIAFHVSFLRFFLMSNPDTQSHGWECEGNENDHIDEAETIDNETNGRQLAPPNFKVVKYIM